MPECRLYTIQGKKQLLWYGSPVNQDQLVILLQEQPISPVIYQNNVTQVINSANSKW